MPRFTLRVSEGGKELSTADVSFPELRFVPETAAVHETPQGEEVALLGWANQLWAPLREPGRQASRAPMGLDRFVALVQGAAGPANPFDGNPAFDSPFSPNRLTHPLAVRRDATQAEVHRARIAEIADAAARLAVIGGVVHQAVHEPVLVQRLGREGARVEVDFRDPTDAVAGPAWSVFRADRGEDALAFAEEVARIEGVPFLGGSGGVRVIYPQVLRVDDVRLAMGDAAERFVRLSRTAPAPAPAIEAALAASVLDQGGFGDAEAAERGAEALGAALDALPGLGLPEGDMRLAAAREVCRRVMARFEAHDLDYLVARDAGPSLAP